MFWEYHDIVIALIKIVGGILLILGSFSKKSTPSKWSKKALFLAGLCAFASGALFFIKLNYGTVMSTRNLRLIGLYKASLGGITLGILITLFLSGELSFKKSRKSRPEDSKENLKIS